jgi:prepilin-type N-terminal cleavage/methylation domain-containing protein
MRSTSDLTARPRGRPGFTLIELLVVVAIIGVLSSLAISGVVKLRAAQMKKFTETTVEKVASAFDTLWKASLDDIKQEEPNLTRLSPVGILANGDQRRARVIYTKMRLKARFPVTFAEALTPDPLNQLVPADPAIAREIVGVNAAAVPADLQSSILLFLSLTQARRGMQAFKPDELDPTAIATVTVPVGSSTAANATQTKVLSYFKDSWERPIRLYTYPVGNLELQESPYVNPTTPALARDPLDPEGTLYAPDWPAALRAQFNQRVHALRNLGQPSAYLMPVIASAGPDGQLGLDPVTMLSTDHDATGDNIYSYRLRRAGARGD